MLLGGLVAGCAVPSEGPRPIVRSPLAAAESFINDFYSFDPVRLQRAMSSAPASRQEIMYYQGWAEGGNYLSLKRQPCRFEKTDEVRCDITVKDDLIAALRTGYHVTDTFHLSFSDGLIVKVRTSSNDPPEMNAAFKWLRRERPDIWAGPCRGFYAGGPTPQDCVRAVVRGFADFTERQAK